MSHSFKGLIIASLLLTSVSFWRPAAVHACEPVPEPGWLPQIAVSVAAIPAGVTLGNNGGAYFTLQNEGDTPIYLLSHAEAAAFPERTVDEYGASARLTIEGGAADDIFYTELEAWTDIREQALHGYSENVPRPVNSHFFLLADGQVREIPFAISFIRETINPDDFSCPSDFAPLGGRSRNMTLGLALIAGLIITFSPLVLIVVGVILYRIYETRGSS